MSHSHRESLTEQPALDDCEPPSPAARIDPARATAKSDRAQPDEINRRQTQLLDKLLAMPVADRGPYLEAAAGAVADDYENDPSVTEFTCLDGEDFEEYP